MSSTCKCMLITDMFFPETVHASHTTIGSVLFTPLNIMIYMVQVLSRISVLGSTFLAILAAGPALVEQTTHLTAFRGFAGTSILILVGCATDTARKVRAEIISQKYKNIELYDFDKY